MSLSIVLEPAAGELAAARGALGAAWKAPPARGALETAEELAGGALGAVREPPPVRGALGVGILGGEVLYV